MEARLPVRRDGRPKVGRASETRGGILALALSLCRLGSVSQAHKDPGSSPWTMG